MSRACERIPLLSNDVLQPCNDVSGALLAAAAVAALYLLARELLRPSALGFKTYAAMTDEVDRRMFVTRITSYVHAVLCVVITGYGIATAPWFPDLIGAEALEGPNSAAEKVAMIHSTGYFLSDLAELYLTYRSTGFLDGGGPMVLHHVLGIFGYVASLAYGRLGYLWCAFLFTELTTPLVNNLFFLTKAGLKKSALMQVNGWSLLISWLLVRIPLSPYLVYGVVRLRATVLSFPPLCWAQMLFSLFAAGAMNYFWFYKIVNGALKSVKGEALPEDGIVDGAKAKSA